MHIGIVLAIGLCIVIGIPAFLIFLLAPRLSGRKRVHPFLGVKWAHRGLHDKKRGIPENSFPAFRAAIEAGDGIELDVHLTKDGQLVVFHDDTFERICGRRGRVEDTSYEEMQKYRLAETKERIPLLSEVLQTFRKFLEKAGTIMVHERSRKNWLIAGNRYQDAWN